MANEILITALFTLIVLALGFAWVGGYLDTYQKKVQERALDMMGENKASYGLKSMLSTRLYRGLYGPVTHVYQVP